MKVSFILQLITTRMPKAKAKAKAKPKAKPKAKTKGPERTQITW